MSAPDMEERIIGCYGAIADASSRMLDAARAGDWDALLAAQADCVLRIEALERICPTPPQGGDARRRRMEVIRQVLAEDAEIRALTQPWLGRLGRLLATRPARSDSGESLRAP